MLYTSLIISESVRFCCVVPERAEQSPWRVLVSHASISQNKSRDSVSVWLVLHAACFLGRSVTIWLKIILQPACSLTKGRARREQMHVTLSAPYMLQADLENGRC